MGKRIKAKTNAGVIEVEIIGADTSRPYLAVNTSERGVYGFIEDKDVKRLRKWCDHCLSEPTRRAINSAKRRTQKDKHGD